MYTCIKIYYGKHIACDVTNVVKVHNYEAFYFINTNGKVMLPYAIYILCRFYSRINY